MPSLPRDVTAFGAEDLAPSAPTPSRPARAAGDFDFEYDDAEALTGTSPQGLGGAKGSEVPEYLDLDAAAIEEARARAAEARARAEEARRAATRATANATTLTIRAKEILDAVSGVKKQTSMSRARSTNAGSPRGKAKSASAKAASLSLSRESSGVRTPTRSERGGVDVEPASADADVSSPAATRARKRSSSSREPAFEPARPRDAGDSTDMEDSDATEPAALPPRAAKRAKPSTVGWAPKATDNIITADGQKVRRGCLNCGCQKTPQWRMGPTGPKTLCNACGVRFRKGMPMHE